MGDEITYEISYRNYKAEAADVIIKDKLDKNVEFVSADNGGVLADGVVTWTLEKVDAGKAGTVSLTVKVLPGALTANGGNGNIVNDGDTATVQVGNDSEFTLNTVENPVPEKKETKPYEGTGLLGNVHVGDEITYEISYRNYKSEAADVIIKDKLDKNVEFVSADNGGTLSDGVVTWTLAGVEAGKTGTVSLTVKVLPGALTANGGNGNVVNDGDTATVKVGNDSEVKLNTVENPVPEKKETKPYEGTGLLGNVRVGDEITYEISYRNYKAEAELVTASDNGVFADGVVTWTLAGVEAGKAGTVSLTVKVLPGALTANGGNGNVVNDGNTATVQVGNDSEFTLNTVENPVPEKKETKPYEGTGLLGNVHVGDGITYEISYRNYKSEAATVTIKDKLDKNVELVSADNGGTLSNGVVIWTLAGVEAGKAGTVSLTVKVLPGALTANGGNGNVVNDGDTATVQVGNDSEVKLNTVENPVPEEPHKKETGVKHGETTLTEGYTGTGTLGGVQVGDEITYEISYRNYKSEAATVTIKDKLDKNVALVWASNGGVLKDGAVTWTLEKVEAGKAGTVSLTVKVLESALVSKGGAGRVINDGKTATVQVDNDSAWTLDTVENPVPEAPRKQEVKPYQGTGVLGTMKVGDSITYEISYRNYKTEAVDIVIKDELDKYVAFTEASDGGVNIDGTVTWTLKSVPAGREGKVTLMVKVLEGAMKSKGGPGKVVNGGETASVKVGNDADGRTRRTGHPERTGDRQRDSKEDLGRPEQHREEPSRKHPGDAEHRRQLHPERGKRLDRDGGKPAGEGRKRERNHLHLDGTAGEGIPAERKRQQ